MTQPSNFEVPPVREEFAEYPTPYRWFCALVQYVSADDARLLRRRGYVWGMIQACHLAHELGISKISALEFGVAGGNGLIALEEIAAKLEPVFKMIIEVVGFDSGTGLPPPVDYRDNPNLWNTGCYQMDVEALRRKVSRSRLILGPISSTVTEFVHENPAPIGFCSIDVDYYSSATDCLKLFDHEAAGFLPRVSCYFDDVVGFTHSEFTGELLALKEFNERSPLRKIGQIPGLRQCVVGRMQNEGWIERTFLAHLFDHPLYGRYDGLVRSQQLPLDTETISVPKRLLTPKELPETRAILGRRLREANTPKRPRTIIFGTGDGGKRTLRFIARSHEVVAFCDNDASRHGTRFSGHLVISPEDIHKTVHDRVIIASVAYRKIFEQIADLKEPLDRVFIVSHEVRCGRQKTPLHERWFCLAAGATGAMVVYCLVRLLGG